jgi:O-antigen/teichoic acid export membrane protein
LLTSVANRALRFAATLILARLLTPADFGVFAIVAAFAGVAGLLCELGLATATVQRSDLRPEQASTVFWINVGSAACISVVGVLAAPWLGRVYADERIEVMCQLLAFGPVVGALGLQHLALLQRTLQFRRTSLIVWIATTAGTLVTLLLAWSGSAFVALAVGILVSKAATTLLAWYSCPWRPGRPKFDPATREMIAFGASLVAFGVLSSIASGLHSIILGLISGAESTGLYFRAVSLLQLVYGVVLGTMATVATTSLAHLKDRPDEFRRYYLGCLSLLCTLCAPAAALGWLFADELMLFIFGSQWGASAPLFAIMCLGAVCYILSHSTGWLYVATGNSGRMMRWGLIGWPAIMLGTLIGLPLGLQGLAVSQTITIIVLFFPCMAFAFHGTGLTWRALGRSIWRPIAAAMISAVLLVTFSDALPESGTARLLAGTALYAMSYLLLLSEAFGQRPQLLRYSHELWLRIARRTAPT